MIAISGRLTLNSYYYSVGDGHIGQVNEISVDEPNHMILYLPRAV